MKKTLTDVEKKESWGMEDVDGIENFIRFTDIDLPILLIGESGVGKNYLASKINDYYNRVNHTSNQMVQIDCGLLNENLIESSLFGHEKGAYTGASYKLEGFFDVAKDGVIFIDEIANLPYNMQCKLLKIIDERTFIPVGSNTVHHCNAHFVFATNKNLCEMVERGYFMRDLFFRISFAPFYVKPLRERKNEIPKLIFEFLDTQKNKKNISPEAIEYLKEKEWKSNLRGLFQTLKGSSAVCDTDTIELSDVQYYYDRVVKPFEYL